MDYTNKIILITENIRIATPIKHALNKLGLEMETDYISLHSPAMMRKAIARTGNTAFIRAELTRFFKERGFPQAIIMDAQTNLGQNEAEDPGKLKLLRTLLISFVIFINGKEYEKLNGNFLLLTPGTAFDLKYGIGKNPLKALDLLATGNPAINGYIDALKGNRKLFDERFRIKLLDSETSSDKITAAVTAFLTRAAGAGEQAGVPMEERPAADETPARIVYRLDDGAVCVDGEVVPATEEYAPLKAGEFYVIGSWISATELEVSKKIAAVLVQGIKDRKRFSFNDPVTFHVDDRCVIDKNTALSLAQLFTKNLHSYKKITIDVSANNGKTVEKSRGYPMIREMVTVEGVKAGAS